MMVAYSTVPSIDVVRTGKRIEAIRKSRGFTVRQLQEYFNFENPQAIYKWQHGMCLPTVDNLLALARLFRVSMEDLLVTYGSEDQEVPLFIQISIILKYFIIIDILYCLLYNRNQWRVWE